MYKKLLFLCTGNSCRSQMAEGLANLKLNKAFKIYSAGVEAHGLNPRAVKAMDEIGIDISGQQSQSISEDELSGYNLIVTLCGDARDRCPVLLGDQRNIHWGLEDPANATGTEKEIMNVYRNFIQLITTFKYFWMLF